MNTVLKTYRQQNPNDSRPDDLLNVLIAEQAPDLLDQFPDFAAEYRAIRRSMAPGLWDEFKGSVGSAADNLQSTAFAAGALGADIVGADGIKQSLLEKAREQAAEASVYDPTVRSYRDIETPGDLASYLAYGAGQIVPSAAESAAFALAGGGVGGIAARQGVKGAAEQVAKEAIKKAVERGSMAGLALASVPQAQGEIYLEIADEPGAAAIAATAGTFAGLLDMIPEGYVLGRFFRPGEVVDEPVKRGIMEYVKRLGVEAAKTMPMEGSTEAAQEFIGLAAGKFARGEPSTLTDRDFEQMMNAGIIGTIGGAMFAPISASSPGKPKAKEASETEKVVEPATSSEAQRRAAEASASMGVDPESPEFVGPPSPAQMSARAMQMDEWAEQRWRQSNAQRELLKQDLARRQFTANDNFDAGINEGVNPDDVWLASSPVDNFLRNGTPAVRSAQVFNEQSAAEERTRQSPQGGEMLRSDLQAQELPAELDFIAKVRESVSNAAQAVAQMQQDEAVQAQLLAREMAGNVPDSMLPPMVGRGTPDPIEFGVTSPQAPVAPAELAFVAPPRDPMQSTSVAPDPREIAPLAALPSAGTVAAPSTAAAPAPSVVANPEPEPPISLSAGADQALASTREIEDFRDNAYTDPLARVQRLRDDAHNNDGLPRVVLILDRATGQLYQRGVRDAGGGITVDAAARPAPKGHGRGQGRVLDIDFTSATSGSRIDRILKQTLADGSDRFEIVGFSVLENGAAKNLNLGDARAYFAAPQFNEKRVARLARKQEQDIKAEKRQVRRSRKVVSEADNVNDRGQPAAEQSTGGITSVNAESRLASFLADLVEMRREKASDAEIRARIAEEIKAQRPDLTPAKMKELVDYTVSEMLPRLEEVNETIRFTTPETSRLNQSDAVGLFQSVVRAVRESGGDVALFEQSLDSELEAVRKAYGIQLTTAEGRSLIAIGTATIQQPQHINNLIKLLHEAGHHFVKKLPRPLQSAFHEALNRAHWSKQQWLMNPLSLDIRLLANAPEGTLSPEQKAALAKLTPSEINQLRQTPPDTLLIEQGAEHLAMLGLKHAEARGLMQAVVRFVKDVMLRMGMALQRALKGEASDRLVRAYVENRWLQFINRDFARSKNAVLDFRAFIGAKPTMRETVQTFSGIGSGDPRVGQVDLATGRWSPVEHAVTDVASLAADVTNAIRLAEAGLADLTRRVTSTSINYTPEVTFNRDAAIINFAETLYRGIFRNPEIHRLLPQEILTADNPQAAFNKEFLGLRDSMQPQAMMDALRGMAVNQKDPLTGRPVNLNDRATIADLPKLVEERTGADGNTIKVEVSSAQDSAMRSSLVSLDAAVARVSRRIAKDEKWMERARRRQSLSQEDQAKLTQLDSRTALAKKVLSELRSEQKRLEMKLERSAPQHFYAGSSYLVPSNDSAGEGTFTTHRLPSDLSFSATAEKEFIAHLRAMRSWLENPANRAQGSAYVQMQRQYKALNEDFTTRYAYQRTNKMVRRSFARSLVETLKVIGTPTSLHAARRITNFQNWIYRFENDAKIRGAQWSKTYQEFARALGKQTNESFDETVWDAFMRAGEQVNETDTQARDRIAAVLRDVYGLPVDKNNRKVWSAFSELVTQTLESQKWERSMFDAMGLRVSDPTLGERRLAQIGYFNGRRTASKLIDSLFIQMNPVWAEADGRSFIEKIEGLANNRGAFSAELARLFPNPVIRDFVEPLVRNNAPFITLRDQGQLTPYDVRMAWEKSGGDMLRFIERIHEQVNAGGDFAETAADVLAGFSRSFQEVRTDAIKRRDTELGSTETTPRQMMDARRADNWPPEWVSYAKYDSSSNYTMLMQLAIQSGIGDGGFGPNSEFTHLIDQALEDIKLIRVEFDELVRQGLTSEQVKQKLGADKYEKALHADDYRWLLDNDKFVENAKALTKTTGYQIGDMKVAVQMLGLISSATLQQPKSALIQSFDPFLAPFWKTKLSTTTFRMVGQGFRSMFAEGANAMGANGLAEWARNGHMVERRLRAGIKDPDAYVSFKQKSADSGVRFGAPDGPESFAGHLNRVATKVLSNTRDVMNVGIPVKSAGAVKIRPLGIFSTVSHAINNAFFDQIYNSVSDLGIRGVEWIEANGGAEVARKLAAGEVRFSPEILGYSRSWLVLNDKPAFEYLADAVVTKMGERSLEDFVVKAWQRKQAAQGGAYEVIDNKQLMGVTTMAMSDMSLHADAINAPLALMNSPFLRLFSTYLVWPWLQMIRGMNVFKTVEGRITAESALDGLTVVMLGAVPATLAASLVADLYDEEVMGKRSNLRELPDKALIPGMAIAYPMASLERLARYGAFGLASEAVNGMLNQDDARGGFSADNRVFLLNQIQNVRNIVGNLYQQEGNITYQSVGRPLLQTIGMNGALQYWQLASRAFGIQSTESEINARINASNYLRATARALDLDVRSSRAMGSLPTPMTPYLQQMELGAITGDTSLFNHGFARAVQEAADAGKEDPMKYVKQAFADRHPLKRIFRTLPSQTEYRQMLSEMDDFGRSSVSRAVMSYNGYLQRLGVQPVLVQDDRKVAAKKQAQLVSSSDARLAAALASYGVSYGGD